MANKRISGLPAASGVSYDDLAPLSQGSTSDDTGTTRKATLTQVFGLLATPPAIGGTTPAAGKFTTLTATGVARFSSGNLTSTGTTQGTAAALVMDYTTVACLVGATGVILPAGLPGARKVIFNDGNASNATLKVYPASGEEIINQADGRLSVNVPQDVVADGIVIFECVSQGFWAALIVVQ